MAEYDSRLETLEHISEVRGLLNAVADDLTRRGEVHDRSKFAMPEKAAFDEYTQRLRAMTFGSPEYEKARAAMGPALDHHYRANDHHPEHFPAGEDHETTCHDGPEYLPGGEITICRAFCSACDWSDKGDPDDVRDRAAAHERETHRPGGVHAMNIIQLLEMLVDWIAATRRHADGDIHRSITQNAGRFNYGESLERLLHMSADAILELEGGPHR